MPLYSSVVIYCTLDTFNLDKIILKIITVLDHRNQPINTADKIAREYCQWTFHRLTLQRRYHPLSSSVLSKEITQPYMIVETILLYVKYF